MQESYRPEDFYKNAQPLVLFDDDVDQQEGSSTCGWFTPGRNWDDNADLQNQYRTATDYKGIHSFFVSLGFSSADAHTLLLPKPQAERERNPGSPLDGIGNPNGAATAWDNWHVEMRRPSGLRLFAHAWEYAGWSNYTKALPKYQGQMTEANKFTYYFTNEDGGRVYPTGFNEEGYAVSSRGIQNIETGEVLSPEAISSGDQEFIESAEFDTPAREEEQGLVKLASIAQIEEGIESGTVTPDAAGNPKGFAYVVRSRDLKQVKEQFVESIGLLNAVDRFVYVAADPADVPEADIKNDGINLGDKRSVSERRDALVKSSLYEAFNFIDSRNVVTGQAIFIKCYTSTTTSQTCIYRGTSQVVIQSGADGESQSDQTHTCASIFFISASQIFLRNANLEFTLTGIIAQYATAIFVAGGSYKLTYTQNRAAHLFFAPSGVINVKPASYQGAASNVTFTANGRNIQNSQLFIAKDLRFDCRYKSALSSGEPIILIDLRTYDGRSPSDAPTDFTFSAVKDSIKHFVGPGNDSSDYSHSYMIFLAGAVGLKGFSLYRETDVSTNTRIAIDTVENAGINYFVTSSADMTTFNSVDFYQAGATIDYGGEIETSFIYGLAEAFDASLERRIWIVGGRQHSSKCPIHRTNQAPSWRT